MKKYAACLFGILALLLCAACHRDPNYVKQQYLQSGNKYFDRGRFKEAMIMYRKALNTDQKYGAAYYRMALTSLKTGQLAAAGGSLRRAVELLPAGSAEWNDASLKLGEMLLRAAQDIDVPGKNRTLLEEVGQIQQSLLARDPHSFAGTKLTGDLLLMQSVDYFRRGNKAQSDELVQQAVAEYRKAIAIDPSDSTVKVALARTLTLRKEFPEAEQLYRAVIGKEPGASVAYTELYRLLMLQGKNGEAEALLKEAARRNPKEHEYDLQLAAHYYGLKEEANMQRALDRLKASFSEYPNAYFTAGDFYVRIGNPREAIRQYEAGLAKDPAHKLDYEKRIIDALIRAGRRQEAYDRDLELLKQFPHDPEARGMKASFLLEKGEVNQAVVELEQVVEAKPDNFVARYDLGRAHFAKHEYEQASQQLGECLKLRPDFLKARLALSQVAMAQGGYDRALKAAVEAQQYAPDDREARLMEAAALMRLGRLVEARAKLENLQKADPNAADVLLEIGVLDLAEKRYAAAAAAFHSSFEKNPATVKALMGEAEAYYRQNQPRRAVQLLQDAADKYPDRTDIFRELAGAHLRSNQFDLAMRELQTLAGRYRNSPRDQAQAYATMAQILNSQGKTHEALDMLAKARSLSPDDVPMLNYYAQSLDHAGQREEAKKIYREALAKDPNNAETLNNLAFLLADLGVDLDQALTLANRAKQRLPNLVEVSDTIGWIYFKKNLSDSAIDAFRDLNEKVPNNSVFRLHYCLALAQKGDRPAAAKECRTALSLRPSHQDESQIRQVLARLG